MTTPIIDPAWQATRNGLPGDTEAVNHASQIDQFLASHAVTPVYTGLALVTPAGNVGFGDGSINWLNLGTVDVDQPFAMPGGKTVIGRVVLPLSPVGNGADVTVSLYTDSSGSPGTLITSVVVPAAHLLQLTAPDGLPAGPLAMAGSNTMRMNDMTLTGWAVPAPAGSAVNPAFATGGNYFILATSENGTPLMFFTVAWPGGTAPGPVLPQPSISTGTAAGALVATPDVLVYAGGYTGATLTAITGNVWTAGWDPATGQVQAWTSQAAIPHPVASAAGTCNPATDTVYVIGGNDVSGFPVSNVWYADAVNGQIGAWKAGPQLPGAAEALQIAAVINGWLVVAGGFSSSTGLTSTQTWLAPVAADGTPGSWIPGPALPAAAQSDGGACYAATDAGLVVIAAPSLPPVVMTLTVTADGPGTWQSQVLSAGVILDPPQLLPVGAFPNGTGTWQVLFLDPASGVYTTGVMSSVPSVSVPLPTTGLTGGATYHIVVHQDGGDAADYVQAAADPSALATAAKTRPAGGGSWTALPNTYSLFAAVYDQTPGGQPVHLWQDAGARVVTLVWGSAASSLLGAVETTEFPAGAPEGVLCEVAQVGYGINGLPSGVTLLA